MPGRQYSAIEERCRRIVNRCGLLERLDESLRKQLITGGSLVDADRREALCLPHDPAIFVIGSGRVRRVVRTPDKELTLGYYGPGDLMGELTLIDPSARLDTIVLDYVEALRIPPQLFRSVMIQDREFSFAVMQLIGNRRMSAERRIDGLLTRSVESRVAEFLVDASKRHGIPDSRGVLIGVKFTHQEIACFVGSTRETVTLVLGEFKRKGIITTDHRRIVVRDPAALNQRV
ncbi:MAG: Crp/Fnr family transcriptional regulator [Polyangiales bacterium]